MSRVPRRAAAAALLAALVLATAVPPARAATPPDAEMARLGEALRRAKAVRVHTPAGPFVERRVGLMTEGVHLPGDAEYGANAITPRQPALVPWENLSAIEVRRGHAERGVFVGALVGFLLGAAWAQGSHDEQTLGGRSGELLFPFFGAACGAGAGAALGAGYDPWTRVWPEPR